MISTGGSADARLGTIHGNDGCLGVIFKGRHVLLRSLYCNNRCGLLTQLIILQLFELLFQILSTDDILVQIFVDAFIDTGATDSINKLDVSFCACLRDLKLSLLGSIDGGFMV